MSQYYKTKSYNKIFYRLLWIVITNNTKKRVIILSQAFIYNIFDFIEQIYIIKS